eukprot:3296562-Rhodomonas_salina.1
MCTRISGEISPARAARRRECQARRSSKARRPSPIVSAVTGPTETPEGRASSVRQARSVLAACGSRARPMRSRRRGALWLRSARALRDTTGRPAGSAR